MRAIFCNNQEKGKNSYCDPKNTNLVPKIKSYLCFSNFSPTETAPFSRRSKYGSDVVSTLAERSVGTDFTIGPRSATSGKRYVIASRTCFVQEALHIFFPFLPMQCWTIYKSKIEWKVSILSECGCEAQPFSYPNKSVQYQEHFEVKASPL